MQFERCPPGRSDADILYAIIALADSCRAPTIATDARRARLSTHVLLQLCMRLRHHLFELQHALQRNRARWMARLKAIELARTLAEKGLDHAAHAPDAARSRIATRLAVARTKFVMATKADALVELSLRTQLRPRRWLRAVVDAQGQEIASTHLASFWMRTVNEVHTPVIAFAQSLCADVESSLADFGELMPRDAFVDLHQPPLGTFFDEMSARIAPSRADLGTLLDTGTHAIVQRLLDYYDHAVCATDARFRERLDGISMAVMHAVTFADAAQREGAAGMSNAQRRLTEWLSTLASLIEEIQ